MTPVPCSSAVSESLDGKKSKAAPLIQKKKEAVNHSICYLKFFLAGSGES
jgi:hypothetical protein